MIRESAGGGAVRQGPGGAFIDCHGAAIGQLPALYGTGVIMRLAGIAVGHMGSGPVLEDSKRVGLDMHGRWPAPGLTRRSSDSAGSASETADLSQRPTQSARCHASKRAAPIPVSEVSPDSSGRPFF